MTIEEIRKMCFDIAAAEGVVISAPIVLNGRLTRTLGRVCYAFDSPYDKTMHLYERMFRHRRPVVCKVL